MSKTIIADIFSLLDLQCFADGGDGAGSGTGMGEATGESAVAAVPQTRGVKNPLANVKYGIQEDAQTADVHNAETVESGDRNAEFERLIKGEYKDLYDARVQDTIQKRLKASKETVDKYNELTPVIEMLAKKYGVEATDIKALNQAITEDDSYYEEEALEKGISVQQLKAIRKIENENAELKKQMSEQAERQNADRQIAQWMQQAQTAKSKYPSLDLRTELQNPQFLSLLRSGIDVDTAYTVIHKDEIIPAAMQHAVKTAEQKITNKIIANGARPTENGLSSQSSAVIKSDVSQLSKADRQEIIRRVARGEKIRF